jgi:lipid II:glycine glycyltransferase (peptidoglycan interpeptide bridge formation enzyme)
LTQAWNELIAALPGAHILQTYEWGQVKIQNGWRPSYLLWLRSGLDAASPVRFVEATEEELEKNPHEAGEAAAAALLLIRPAGGGLPMSLAYCPRGPLLDWENEVLRRQVLADLAESAGRQGAILLKIDPEVRLGTGIPGTAEAEEDPSGADVTRDLLATGWRSSREQVQFKNTVVLDLTPPPEEILARFKPKMRYNIRLSERKGVVVRSGEPSDIPLLFRLYAETAVRDGFTIRELGYYENAWGIFLKDQRSIEDSDTSRLPAFPAAEALVAEAEGRVLAGIIVYRFARRAWFLFGMSASQDRERMPNHRLQWEAILRMRQAGCTAYDLWGAPDEFIETDPLWGVYRFKEGFQAEISRTIGAWDLPIRPAAYTLYTRLMPKVLDLMRGRGNRRTRQEAA